MALRFLPTKLYVLKCLEAPSEHADATHRLMQTEQGWFVISDLPLLYKNAPEDYNSRAGSFEAASEWCEFVEAALEFDALNEIT